MRCSVAVLQFQNRLYESQKLTLYLFINIEVFLGYGNSFKRTATLQQLQQRAKPSSLELCRAPVVVDEVNNCNRLCQITQEKYRRKMKNFL